MAKISSNFYPEGKESFGPMPVSTLLFQRSRSWPPASGPGAWMAASNTRLRAIACPARLQTSERMGSLEIPEVWEGISKAPGAHGSLKATFLGTGSNLGDTPLQLIQSLYPQKFQCFYPVNAACNYPRSSPQAFPLSASNEDSWGVGSLGVCPHAWAV